MGQPKYQVSEIRTQGEHLTCYKRLPTTCAFSATRSRNQFRQRDSQNAYGIHYMPTYTSASATTIVAHPAGIIDSRPLLLYQETPRYVDYGNPSVRWMTATQRLPQMDRRPPSRMPPEARGAILNTAQGPPNDACAHTSDVPPWQERKYCCSQDLQKQLTKHSGLYGAHRGP